MRSIYQPMRPPAGPPRGRPTTGSCWRSRRLLIVLLTIVTTAVLIILAGSRWPSSATGTVMDLDRVRTSLLLMEAPLEPTEAAAVVVLPPAAAAAAAAAAPAAAEAEAEAPLPLLPKSPWLSPQGLEPPAPTNLLPGRAHVRVVIRVHHLHAHLVRALLEQLRHQSTTQGAPATVDFALVATETRGLNVTCALAAEAWVHGYRDVYAVHLPDAFWAQAKERSLAFACTSAEAVRFKREYGAEGMRRICVYDNLLYYLVRASV
jgi:hypothetical protein